MHIVLCGAEAGFVDSQDWLTALLPDGLVDSRTHSLTH